MEDPHWSSLILKDCSLCTGLALLQVLKLCGLWEGLTLGQGRSVRRKEQQRGTVEYCQQPTFPTTLCWLGMEEIEG